MRLLLPPEPACQVQIYAFARAKTRGKSDLGQRLIGQFGNRRTIRQANWTAQQYRSQCAYGNNINP
jgi:hypothetical protein